MVGGATGLRKSEMRAIRGTALSQKETDGFYYFVTKGKGGRVREAL